MMSLTVSSYQFTVRYQLSVISGHWSQVTGNTPSTGNCKLLTSFQGDSK